MMEAVGTSETSVNLRYTAWRNIPKGCHLHCVFVLATEKILISLYVTSYTQSVLIRALFPTLLHLITPEIDSAATLSFEMNKPEIFPKAIILTVNQFWGIYRGRSVFNIHESCFNEISFQILYKESN
jgi:hypothetical protein